MTRTQSDSIDPSLPEAATAPPDEIRAAARQVQPAVPISGDVAAEIVRQLADMEPAGGDAAKKPPHRIYAVREPAGSMLPGGAFSVPPASSPPSPLHGPGAVDETAVLNRMLDMNRSQVMRGVEDTVKRTNGGKTAAKGGRRAGRGSARVEAQRLDPPGSDGMRRIDPDPPHPVAARK